MGQRRTGAQSQRPGRSRPPRSRGRSGRGCPSAGPPAPAPRTPSRCITSTPSVHSPAAPSSKVYVWVLLHTPHLLLRSPLVTARGTIASHPPPFHIDHNSPRVTPALHLLPQPRLPLRMPHCALAPTMPCRQQFPAPSLPLPAAGRFSAAPRHAVSPKISGSFTLADKSPRLSLSDASLRISTHAAYERRRHAHAFDVSARFGTRQRREGQGEGAGAGGGAPWPTCRRARCSCWRRCVQAPGPAPPGCRPRPAA